MNKPFGWMIIGCTILLLLLILSPFYGITENISFLIFILAMLAWHLLMPDRGGHQHTDQQENTEVINAKHHGQRY
jgi:hypothetical protein